MNIWMYKYVYTYCFLSIMLSYNDKYYMYVCIFKDLHDFLFKKK